MKTLLEILASNDPAVRGMLIICAIVFGGVLASIVLCSRKDKSTDY